MTREKLLALAESRHNKPWRGKDIKKLLPIPWLSRIVVFTCSNGWTIERIEKDDARLEGLLMGHCLGLKNGRSCWRSSMLSLRDERGVPHVTLDRCWGTTANLVGRCNGTPPEKYVSLCREFLPDARPQKGWGKDEDATYHEQGVLSDKDYRDMPGASARAWHTDEYTEKRGK